MNIDRKKTKRNKMILISIIILIIAIFITLCLIYFVRNKKDDNYNDNKNSVDLIINEDSSNNKTNNTRESSKDPIQNDSSGVDQSNLTGYITAKNIVDEHLQIRVQIEQYLTTGSCAIKIGGYSERVEIINNPSSSTCYGWDIPIASLQKGTQNITITIISDSKQMIITDEINI